MPAAQEPKRHLDPASFEARLRRFRELSAAGLRGFEVVGVNDDGTKPAASTPPVYVYHSAWAARVLATARPKRHVAIDTCPYFAAIAAAFVPVDYYTVRPPAPTIPGLRTGSVELPMLPFRDGSIPSLSCAGLVESLGFGREADEIDPDADLKAIAQLNRVLAPDGSLLFICPIGKPRVIFDSHRVYSFGQVLDCFEGLDLEEFALIPENGAGAGLLVNPDERVANRQEQGVGCFWLRKPPAGGQVIAPSLAAAERRHRRAG